ncbi:MAG: shikimate kinase [Bacteroidetes bacterium]|nr:shikimate kinase [Bacteroidota bacterium]HMU25714.1 shikimate kinase [Ferruginibacter sp.]
MKKRIYLIGFMGTGKSYWGQVWSKKYQLPFINLDARVEEKENGKVLDIFEQKGEDYFRKVEAECLRATASTERAIIACGGGTPCALDNMQWMNENGITLLLEASPAEVFENIKRETRSRPLLKDKNEGELIFFIEKLMAERKAFYDRANFKYPIKDLNSKTLDELIEQHLKSHHA